MLDFNKEINIDQEVLKIDNRIKAVSIQEKIKKQFEDLKRTDNSFYLYLDTHFLTYDNALSKTIMHGFLREFNIPKYYEAFKVFEKDSVEIRIYRWDKILYSSFNDMTFAEIIFKILEDHYFTQENVKIRFNSLEKLFGNEF